MLVVMPSEEWAIEVFGWGVAVEGFLRPWCSARASG